MNSICLTILALLAAAAAVGPVRAEDYRVVYSFQAGQDGRSPAGSLLYVDGTLYGTTQGGGKHGCGTVFSLNPQTGAERVLYAFKGCTVDSHDGANPSAGLIDIGGTVYGTTEYGGSAHTFDEFGYGTVFSLVLATGVEDVLHLFRGDDDGAYPSGLIDVRGTLYGTTAGGPHFEYEGTVFALDPATGTQRILYSFRDAQSCCGGDGGIMPAGSLVDVDGILYGVTVYGGGAHSFGTLFSVDPHTSAEAVVYSFSGGADGQWPGTTLVNVHGRLYGATEGGGSTTNCEFGCGTLFSLDPATGNKTTLYSFQVPSPGRGRDIGDTPGITLTKVGNRLFGTTDVGGGRNQYGTTFVLDVKTSEVKQRHHFRSGGDGADPGGRLLDVAGTLYGTTATGGAAGYGTVFAFTP